MTALRSGSVPLPYSTSFLRASRYSPQRPARAWAGKALLRQPQRHSPTLWLTSGTLLAKRIPEGGVGFASLSISQLKVDAIVSPVTGIVTPKADSVFRVPDDLQGQVPCDIPPPSQ